MQFGKILKITLVLKKKFGVTNQFQANRNVVNYIINKEQQKFASETIFRPLTHKERSTFFPCKHQPFSNCSKCLRLE